MRKSSSGAPVFGSHIGTSSILLIFVVICLVSFAALSIASANADYVLTKKIADRTSRYYEACSDANLQLAETDAWLLESCQASSDREQYYDAVGEGDTFRFSLSDYQWLEVKLNYLYPENADGPYYEIAAWKVCTDTERMEYNETLPVMQ